MSDTPDQETVETPETQEMSETETVDRVKKAHFRGWANQFISSGKTFEDAKSSYDANNAAAEKVMTKYAGIQDTILAEVNKGKEVEAEV
jgi:hypothetical protein